MDNIFDLIGNPPVNVVNQFPEAFELPEWDCIRILNCSRCHFKFVPLDPIAAVTPFKDSPAYFFENFLHLKKHLNPRTNSINVCHQYNTCGHNRLEFYHDSCYHSMKFRPSVEFLLATAYSFMPSNKHENARWSFLKRETALGLVNGFPSPLPVDVLEMIGGLLFREYISAYNQTMFDHRCSLDTVVDFRKSIYASYVEIDGNKYISNLWNSSNLGSLESWLTDRRRENIGNIQLTAKNGKRAWQSAKQIYDVNSSPKGGLWRFFVAFDHIGIREISIKVPDVFIHAEGVWWVEVPLDEAQTALFKTDGIKLRTAQDPWLTPPNSFDPLAFGWPFPDPSGTELFGTSSGIPISVSRLNPRLMSPVGWNEPNLDGYLFGTADSDLTMIAAQYRGQDDPCRELATAECQWHAFEYIYLPINNGEYVEQIWGIVQRIRVGEMYVDTALGLQFVTNHGRSIRSGYWFDDRRSDISFICYAVNDGRPSVFFVEDWNKRLQAVGMGGVAFLKADRPDDTIPKPLEPDNLRPSGRPPNNASGSIDWRYSTCSLENVQMIAASTVEEIDHCKILGLMFFYTDGTRACVGEYRKDWASREYHVDSVHPLRLLIEEEDDDTSDEDSDSDTDSESETPLYYVGDLNIDGTHEPAAADSQWITIPWKGRLEWWFRRDRVCIEHVE